MSEKKKKKEIKKKEIKKKEEEKNNKIGIIVVIFLVIIFIGIVIVINVVLPKVHYNKAIENFNLKKYDEAINEFLKLDINYENTKQKLSTSYFESGKEKLQNEKYEEASNLFEKSSEQESIKYKDYSDAMNSYSNKEYDNSISLFKKLDDFLDSKEYYLKSNYYKAEELYEEKKYERAIMYYTEALEYEDAKDKVIDSNYNIAEDYYNKKNYTKAKEYYKLVPGYKDSKYKTDVCNYVAYFEQAENYYKAGSLYKAQQLYNKIPSSFKYNNIKVGDRKKTLKKYKQFVALTKKKWSGKGKYVVRSVHDSTGYWNSWTNKFSDSFYIKCIIRSDGSVNIKGEASFETYTNYSSLSSLLDIDYEYVTINVKVKKGKGVPRVLVKNRKIGTSEGGARGRVNVTYSGGKIRLSYTCVDRNYSAYFTQRYTSNITYKRK